MDDPAASPPRLGWARILAIAVSCCAVGFAVFFAAYAGLRGAAPAAEAAPAVLPAAPWATVAVAALLIAPPAAAAALTWVGARKAYVWAAAACYLALVPVLGVGVGPHLAVGVAPTVVAAALYTLPRRGARAGQAAASPTAS